MKKIIALILSLISVMTLLVGCSGDENSTSSSVAEQKDTIEATVSPVVYSSEAIKKVEETNAGNYEDWLGEKSVYGTATNSVIESPFHTLKVNGQEVPVYTVRSKRGAHSFAWVDVQKTRRDWHINVELTTTESYGKCVVLPESTEVLVDIKNNVYTCKLYAFDTYSFTFATEASASVTDPLLAPLTLMVTEEKPFKLPTEYDTVTVEPGIHQKDELIFTQEFTAYVIKAGYHELAGIKLPSNSLLYIESGAYIKGIDQELSLAVIGGEDIYNVQIIARGIIDCGAMSYEGNKHPFWFSRVEDLSVEGLAFINANTWTMCFCDCTDLTIERNLLLGYRNTSDGIMMSDCVNGVGRYNFVRTGDDGIEFKATGWGRGANEGYNCVYEYNDCWTDRVSAYGLIWENTRNLSNVTFRNNSVGFAYAGENGYLCPLEIRLGANSNSTWKDVLYENIELYYVDCATVITVKVNSSDGGGLGGGGAIVDNITYKNIYVNACREGCVAFKMYFGDNTGGDITNVLVENMQFCGKILTANDKFDSNYFVNEAGEKFETGLTVK